MADNFIDLPLRASTFAYERMAIHVMHEYDEQMGKWEEQINNLLACARAAYNKHNNFLQDIRKQQDADHEMAMLAMSIMAGPALSWISGAIQYKIFPRLFGRRKYKEYAVGGDLIAQKPLRPGLKPPPPRRTPIKWVPTVDPLSHDKVAAKVFADLGGKLSDKLLVNPAIKALAPNARALEQAVAAIGDSTLLGSFEKNIKNAWVEGKLYGAAAIMNYAGMIHEDRGYGDTWVAKLNREQPSLKDPGLREDAIRRMIREAIDTQRQDWARGQDWFYYSNDPAPFNEIVAINAMEAEIWRLWILCEDFTGKRSVIKNTNPYWTEGRSRIPLDRVLDRLVDLGVFAGRNQSERNKIFKRIEDANNLLPPDPEPPKSQPLGAMNPETFAKQQEELRKPADLLPVEAFGVEDKVDTPEELQAVLDWATTRKPHALGGKLAAVPRAINPLKTTNLKTTDFVQ